MKTMLPGRKIKSGLILLPLVIFSLFAVVLLSPKSSSAQTPTPTPTPPGSGTVPLGGSCTDISQCQNADNRCGGVICWGNKCRTKVCDLANCQSITTGNTDTVFHDCQYDYLGLQPNFCCPSESIQQCSVQCCPWTQSTCGGRSDWGNLGDGFGPTTCLATQKLEYNDCNADGARNRVCKNYCDCGATTDRTGVACPTPTPTRNLTPTSTPTPTPIACPWDIIKTGTSNGKVDGGDLAKLNACYAPLGGIAANCGAADLNGNSVVNALDYSLLLTHWGSCP